MNDVVQSWALIRLELSCLYCGHSCGEVGVRTAGRPSYGDIRRAFRESASASAPTWDAHGIPRCPRCSGKLIIEQSERRSSVAAH